MCGAKIVHLLFVFSFCILNSIAQTTTYITDVTGDIYEVNLSNCTTTLISTGNFSFTDIAYCAQSDIIYGLNEFGQIYSVSASVGGTGSFVGTVSSVGSYTGMVGMVCDENGLLYITAYSTSFVGGYIYTYDPSNNTTTNIGSLPSFVEPAGDLTYYNGQLIVSTYANEIYSVDLSAPSFSTLLYSYSSNIDAFGITSINCGQDLILSSGDELLLFDNTTSQTTVLCTLPSVGLEINGATSTSELPMDLNLGEDTSICGIFNLVLDAQNQGSSFLWNNGSTGQTLQVNTPGTYWVEVTSSNCVSSDTIVISPLPGPTVDLGNDTTLCNGSTLVLDAQNSGSAFVWNDNSSNQTLLVNNPGLYYVAVTSGSCTSGDTVLVDFESNPLDLGPDLEVCSSTLLDAGNTGLNYLWNDGSTGQTVQADTIGTYWVELSTNYCTYFDTIELTLGSIDTGLPNDTVLCQNSGSLILDAQNVGSNYLWQDGSTNQFYTVSSEGDYWVHVSFGWCEVRDTVTVTFSNPIVDFQVLDTIGCGELLTSFFDLSVSSSDPIISWSWSFGDGSSSSIQNPTHAYASSGNYVVTLSVVTVGGCQETVSRNVEILIYPSPQADFSFSPAVPQLGETIYFTDQSSQVFDWFWQFGNGSSSDLQNPEQTYDTEGNYLVSLLITDINGCMDSIQRLIQLTNDIVFYVPNSFTPNGDEYNNDFQVVIGSDIDKTDFHLMIYSRWGEVVYESFNHESAWDGTFKGKTVQDGIYTWVVVFNKKENAETEVFHGHVNVLR